MPPKTLFIAYGNPDRQDDGVAWYLLQKLAAHFGQELIDTNADYYDMLGRNPDFFFTLQLIPEQVDLIVEYDRVCFLDAHMDDQEGDISFQTLAPHYEPSTLSHHMTPQFLLDIALDTHERWPNALLVSIKGHEFAFVPELTNQTRELADQALPRLLDWFNS
jgi:hydrogenase maturation protease